LLRSLKRDLDAASDELARDLIEAFKK